MQVAPEGLPAAWTALCKVPQEDISKLFESAIVAERGGREKPFDVSDVTGAIRDLKHFGFTGVVSVFHLLHLLACDVASLRITTAEGFTKKFQRVLVKRGAANVDGTEAHLAALAAAVAAAAEADDDRTASAANWGEVTPVVEWKRIASNHPAVDTGGCHMEDPEPQAQAEQRVFQVYVRGVDYRHRIHEANMCLPSRVAVDKLMASLTKHERRS